jgi:hypothetical protein
LAFATLVKVDDFIRNDTPSGVDERYLGYCLCSGDRNRLL